MSSGIPQHSNAGHGPPLLASVAASSFTHQLFRARIGLSIVSPQQEQHDGPTCRSNDSPSFVSNITINSCCRREAPRSIDVGLVLSSKRWKHSPRGLTAGLPFCASLVLVFLPSRACQTIEAALAPIIVGTNRWCMISSCLVSHSDSDIGAEQWSDGVTLPPLVQMLDILH